MAFVITKGDITIRTDSLDEAEQVVAWLIKSDSPEPPPAAMAVELPTLPVLQSVSNPFMPMVPSPPPLKSLVQYPSEEDNVVQLGSAEPHMIPVRVVLMEVLEVVKCFPEGITSRGVSELTGVEVGRVSHRLTRLKKMGLVESVKGSINWRATQLARRAKLVAS